jgi:hypothetical protein
MVQSEFLKPAKVKTYLRREELPENRGPQLTNEPSILSRKSKEQTRERRADRSFNSTGEEEHYHV